ncbi:MAG: rod shape-determining protein MreD [Acidimicrobiales bacterium]|jgi:rod shape-determining protein MreD|nr:rod shape-determining protein MreD [Acidimicrobiales bacterium]HLV89504.1 rod shape-determining protein MreD [Acidimicrobiia bacterium]
MRIPKAPLVLTMMILAIVVQTTLLGQVRSWAPDLVVLMVILFALTRIRAEFVLLIGFSSGLILDLIGTSLIGLRAVVYTTVAYAAMRTIHYAEIGRVTMGLWAGVLTFMALALVIVLGTLFGQTNVVGPDVGSRMIVIPLLNAGLAALSAPLFVRIVDRDTGIFGYS